MSSHPLASSSPHPPNSPRLPSPLRVSYSPQPRRRCNRQSPSPFPLFDSRRRPQKRQDRTRSYFNIFSNPHLGALLFDRHHIGASTTPTLDDIDHLEYMNGVEDFPLSVQSLEDPRDNNDIFPTPLKPNAHIPELPAEVPRLLWPAWKKLTRYRQYNELLKDYDQSGRASRDNEQDVRNGVYRILDTLMETAWEITGKAAGWESARFDEPYPYSVATLVNYTTHPYINPGIAAVKQNGTGTTMDKGKKRAAGEVEADDEEADSLFGATERQRKRRARVGFPDVAVSFGSTVRCIVEAKKAPRTGGGMVGVSAGALVRYDNQVRQRLNSATTNGSARLWAISCVGHYIRPYFWEGVDPAKGPSTQAGNPSRAYPGTVRPSNAAEIRFTNRNGGGPSFDDWYDLKLEATKLFLQQMALDIMSDSVAHPAMYGPSGEGAWQHTTEPTSSPHGSPPSKSSQESAEYVPEPSTAAPCDSAKPRRSKRLENSSGRQA